MSEKREKLKRRLLPSVMTFCDVSETFMMSFWMSPLLVMPVFYNFFESGVVVSTEISQSYRKFCYVKFSTLDPILLKLREVMLKSITH